MLGSLPTSSGPASSVAVSSTPELNEGRDFLIPGSNDIAGMAHSSSDMWIQKGSHKLWLMVKDASVGPMNETT